MEKASTELPAVFGRYLLLRRISRGGMGEIFLAKAGDVRGFEKLYTIKKILPHLSHDEAFVKRFTEEAQLAIKLNHINIAPVFEVGMVDDDLFLALEFVDGRDIRRVLSQCHSLRIQVPQDIALFVAKEISNGLAYAHRRTDETGMALNLVHCDISPPNILVSFEGEVKIIDFGVARSALGFQDNEPATGFGKLGYMAPEQLLKGRTVDRRTDLYSLGVVLYEMLVGDRMLNLDPKADHKLNVRKIVFDTVIPPSKRVAGLDPRLDGIVMKAVAKDPKERFQDATEFRKQIQMVLAEINPTLSPDDLGHFLKETFLDELEKDRFSLQSAHAIDLAPYVDKLHDAGEATVSYAVTNMWELPPQQSGNSDVAAQVLGEPTSRPSERIGGKVSGWVWGAAAGGAVLLLIIIALLIFQPFSEKDEEQPGSAKATGQAKSGTGSDEGINKDLIIMEEPKDDPPDDLPPEEEQPRKTRKRNNRKTGRKVHRQTKGRRQPARQQTRKPGRGSSKEGMKPEEEKGVDRQAVLKKFNRVKAQYTKFKAGYGGRLESRWQAILNAAVYSGNDKNERLNRMLDSLVRQMRAVQKKQEQP